MRQVLGGCGAFLTAITPCRTNYPATLESSVRATAIGRTDCWRDTVRTDGVARALAAACTIGGVTTFDLDLDGRVRDVKAMFDVRAPRRAAAPVWPPLCWRRGCGGLQATTPGPAVHTVEFSGHRARRRRS